MPASPNLCSSDGNQSIKEGLSMGKQKSNSGGTNMAKPEKRLCTDSNNSAGAPRLPWEAKKMKIDLIAAKAKITKLEASVNHQQTIRKEMQILFEAEKQSLKDQHKRDERKLAEMKYQLQLIQRSEKEIKEDMDMAAKEYRENKTRWDAERGKLHKQIADLKDKLLEEQVSTQNQTSEMKKDMEELLQALQGAQAEVEILKKEVAKQTGRAEQCTTYRTQLENQTIELLQVNNKLRELEYERDSYKDWQQQAKTAQNRLCNMAKLEKEVVRLRVTERNLRETLGNKLFMQEQVRQLTSRVEVLQPVQQELMQAKVKIASLESSLSEWVSAAQAHGVESARALSAALESAVNDQLTAADHSSQAGSQTAQLTEVKIASLESSLSEWVSAAQAHGVESPRALSAALESAVNGQLTAADHSSQAGSQTAQLTEVKIASLESSLSEWVSAAQAHGVDSPRALSAALESAVNGQLTAADHSSQAGSQTAQLTEVKIASLESSLSEWVSAAQAHGVDSPRALSAALESAVNGQLTAADHSSQAGSQTAQLTEVKIASLESSLSEWVSAAQAHGVDSPRALSAALESAVNGQLTAADHSSQAGSQTAQLTEVKIASLESSLSEWVSAAQAHGVESPRALSAALESAVNGQLTAADHSSQAGSQTAQLTEEQHMTAAAAHKQTQLDLEAAQEEIKKLKAALDEGQNATQSSPEEVEQLKRRLVSSRIKMERMKEEFTSSTQEYRDICYMLLGYKVDKSGDKEYRISSVYAESPEEYVIFTLREDVAEFDHTLKTLNLRTLKRLVELHLSQHNSIPVFLSALTMELFTRANMKQTEDSESD